MSRERRAHGARPRMSAALRHAMDTLRADRDAFPGDRLIECGIAEQDARELVHGFVDYFEDKDRAGSPLRLAFKALWDAGEQGRDPDAHPLLDVLKTLPEGQRATLHIMLDLMCAYAAAEGVATGALYVAHEINGRNARARSRPRR